MLRLPQELIHAIVHEVDDNESLKRCSLVSPAFREPSQRILLHLLTIGESGDDKPFTVVSAFLQKSPHIAAYCTQLACALPDADAPPAEIRALSAILPVLSNVRCCYLIGEEGKHQAWHQEASRSILEFLRVGRLATLHVLCIKALPIAVLGAFFGAAPTLSLFEIEVERNTLEDEYSPPPPLVKSLLLMSSSGVAPVLLSRQFGPQLANIRKLFWNRADDDEEMLISSVAHNVDHIRMQYDSDTEPSRPLPPLLRVESVEIPVDLDETGDLSAIERVASVLTAAPKTLKAIFILCLPEELPVQDILTAIDDLVIGSPACPRLCWRVDLEDQEHFTLAEYAAALQLGMPKLHAKGKLNVEPCSFMEEGFSHWAARKRL
ncbi:hypothetical protein DFH06DRAFT_1196530 [Mycena polygramma]|nr:hypothetical protein DFH06DRAFT_1196530 [Mycena polygramma]